MVNTHEEIKSELLKLEVNRVFVETLSFEESRDLLKGIRHILGARGQSIQNHDVR